MRLDPWMVLGFGAQGLFSARFLVQWIVTERRHRSTIPKAFWYLSLAGSALKGPSTWSRGGTTTPRRVPNSVRTPSRIRRGRPRRRPADGRCTPPC